ncbi:hypothetical protein [Streptomyces sp. AB3(2024)]|uniref:hypothetical protein n=1 Tax=Streptomyces sp. AB3(2024) TaxID=3317321 RepID=UPI0035A28F2A
MHVSAVAFCVAAGIDIGVRQLASNVFSAAGNEIEQALHAKRAGTVPDLNKDAGDFGDRDPDNFSAEVAWLTQVAVVNSAKRVESSRPVCPPSGRAGFPFFTLPVVPPVSPVGPPWCFRAERV